MSSSFKFQRHHRKNFFGKRSIRFSGPNDVKYQFSKFTSSVLFPKDSEPSFKKEYACCFQQKTLKLLNMTSRMLNASFHITYNSSAWLYAHIFAQTTMPSCAKSSCFLIESIGIIHVSLSVIFTSSTLEHELVEP